MHWIPSDSTTSGTALVVDGARNPGGKGMLAILMLENTTRRQGDEEKEKQITEEAWKRIWFRNNGEKQRVHRHVGCWIIWYRATEDTAEQRQRHNCLYSAFRHGPLWTQKSSLLIDAFWLSNVKKRDTYLFSPPPPTQCHCIPLHIDRSKGNVLSGHFGIILDEPQHK